MPLRLLLHIPRGTIKIALYTLLIGIVAFFALTRTQVGRDQLRGELERRFAKTYEGRLRIGELTGNLVSTLYARDVRLFDPDGRLVLSIDSVVAHPHWRHLLRREFSLSGLTLIRPTAHLYRDADGRWNLASALRSTAPGDADAPSSEPATPWTFVTGNLEVIDGRIRTKNDGPPPEAVARGNVFDYTQAEVEHLSFRAVIDWQRDLKQIDLLAFSAGLAAPPFAVEQLFGQFVWEGKRFSIPQLALRAGATEIDLSGAFENLAAVQRGAFHEAETSLNLAPSRIDFDALRSLFPRLPLADAVRVEARAAGTLDAMVVEKLSLERGVTRIVGEGTLFGLPDSLDFEVSFRQNVLRTSDLRAVVPGMGAFHAIRLDSLIAELYTEGVVHLHGTGAPERIRVSATVDLQSESGNVVGTVGLSQTPAGTLRYAADLYTNGLDVGRLFRKPALTSRLNGRITAEGSGLTADSLDGHLTVALRNASFAGRHLDSLRLDLLARRRVFSARAYLEQPDGVLFTDLDLDTRPGEPVYRLTMTARDFDLGPVLLNDSLATRLNARLRLDGAGTSDPELRVSAEAVFDRSTVRLRDRTRVVAPHRTRLRLTPRFADAPRLEMTGDAGTLRLDGDAPLAAVAAVARLWGEAFAETARREWDKTYPSAALETGIFALPFAPPAGDPVRRAEARRAFADAGLDGPLALTLSLRLDRSDLVTAFFPGLPVLETDLEARLTLAADTDRLHLEGSFSGDSLRAGALFARTLAADLHADAHLDAPLAQTLNAHFDARADTLTLGRRFPDARLSLRYDRRSAALRLSSQTNGRIGPIRLAARLDLLPDRNRLTLDTLFVAAGDYTWTNPQPDTVYVFSDAVATPRLRIESRGPTPETTQRIEVHGALSEVPADTVFIEAETFALRQLTDFVALNPRFGGLFNGRIALSGGLRRPRLTGNLTVDAFTLDEHILGDLHVASRFVPGRPDVELELELAPTRFPDTTFVFGTAIPATVTENRLHLGGLFRLPRFSPEGDVRDPGAWNLHLDVARADLFFFEKIIGALDDVEGFVAGSGSIGGAFAHPVFDADLRIREAGFYVPDVNLRFAVEADVTVDADAIRIRRGRFTDATGGTMDLTGDVLFNDYKFFSFDLAAALDAVQIIDVDASDELPFYGHIWASGHATLTGPLFHARLRSSDAVTTPDSELFIPVAETATGSDESFIIFADSTGRIPDLRPRLRRANLLAHRPEGERPFLEGMDLDIDLFAPPGSTVHLVIDPLLGDVINAVGSGRIQIQRKAGELLTFGTFEVSGGDYLFTAGEVFVRRFRIEPGGSLTWDGDPINAVMNIPASYHTRASRAGLPALGNQNDQSLIPLIVKLQISGRVAAPVVNLSLAIDRTNQSRLGDYQGIEALLNQPERATEYATSVLLTNSFRLTTSSIGNGAGGQLAFNSVSQLVSSQLNRFLNEALPNVDFSFGLQGENARDLDVTYGVALRLLDERLIIRGEGVYQGSRSGVDNVRNESLQGEFVVEVRLNPNVSVEIFYRREGDVLAENAALTNTTGAGLSYQTEFSTWGHLFRKLFGWLIPDKKKKPPPPGEKIAGGETGS
ncbi:translocation/assembly module TamB domain-containing protein [Rhodocaloribacter sp.]